MIRSYLFRTLKSYRFVLSILGVFIVCMLRLTNGAITASDVVGDLDLLVNLDAFRKVIAVFSAIPFASTFADEWNNNVTLLYVLRSSAKKYSWSQVLVCFSISFLTALSGFLLFIIADSFRLPLYLPDGNPAIPPYGCFLENNMVYMNLLLVSVGFSLSCAMWSTTGLLMSSIFPSSFIAFCTPFVASYLLERITLNFPPQFNLLHVALSRINVLNNPWTSFLWVVVVFTVLSLITGKLFVHIVEKRIRNEIS